MAAPTCPSSSFFWSSSVIESKNRSAGLRFAFAWSFSNVSSKLFMAASLAPSYTHAGNHPHAQHARPLNRSCRGQTLHAWLQGARMQTNTPSPGIPLQQQPW